MTGPEQVDVLVVGAGGAGLAAAAAAASAGARTLLVDGYARPGGQYHRQPGPALTTGPGRAQRQGAALAAAAVAAGAELRPDTTVWHAGPGELSILDPGGPGTVGHRALVVATGATERAAAFPGWTLPGVLTTGGLQALLKEHGVVPGRRVLLVGSGPLQLVVAAALVARGVEVAGVCEATRLGRHALARPHRAATGLLGQWSRTAEGLAALATLTRAGVRIRSGWGIVAASGTGEVEAAVVARLDRDWRPVPGTGREIVCDTIGLHHGLVPATDLLRLLGATVTHRPDLGGWVPDLDDRGMTTVPGVFAAGDCTGIGGIALARIEGEIAGAAAAAHALGGPPPDGSTAGRSGRRLRRERRFQQLYGELFGTRPGLVDLVTPDTVLCRCEEVTAATVDAALDRGATTVETVKSLTRCGMGPCQGRVCLPGLGQLVALRTGEAPLAPVAARSPLTPVPLAALEGR